MMQLNTERKAQVLKSYSVPRESVYKLSAAIRSKFWKTKSDSHEPKIEQQQKQQRKIKGQKQRKDILVPHAVAAHEVLEE